VLAGCTTTVGGSAVRETGTASRGNLAQILPTTDEISTAVGNPLADNGSPAVGGIEVLPNGIRDSTMARPIDCLGPVAPFMRVVYEQADVRGAAWQQFSNYGAHEVVSSADTAVIEFSSDAEAQRVFTSFVAQWKACEGTTVTTYTHNADNTELYGTVTDTLVAGPVLSTTIINGDNQQNAQFPTERALGITADCIVDVDVAVTDGTPAQQAAGRRAVTLAMVMLDKVARAR
jgi:PknH-like extracellular domain